MKIDDFRTFSEKNHNKTCRKNLEKMKTNFFCIFFCNWNLHKDALYRNLETPESRKYMKPRDFFFYIAVRFGFGHALVDYDTKCGIEIPRSWIFGKSPRQESR